jgi:transcriptional regulator with GAF, ATPase, and Fis domain
MDFRSLLPVWAWGEAVSSAEKKLQVLELDQLVRDHIRRVLKMTHSKVYGPEGAADVMGVNATTLRNRMNKLGIPCKRRDSLPN